MAHSITLVNTWYQAHAVNSLMFIMFMGINVCVFETKPCSRGLVFVGVSGLVNYLGS